MVYGLWFYGLWFMVYGLWFMVYDGVACHHGAAARALHAVLQQDRVHACRGKGEFIHLIHTTRDTLWLGPHRAFPPAARIPSLA